MPAEEKRAVKSCMRV